jgi:hypothetical protein
VGSCLCVCLSQASDKQCEAGLQVPCHVSARSPARALHRQGQESLPSAGRCCGNAGKGKETLKLPAPEPTQRITYHAYSAPLHKIKTENMLPLQLLTPFQANASPSPQPAPAARTQAPAAKKNPFFALFVGPRALQEGLIVCFITEMRILSMAANERPNISFPAFQVGPSLHLTGVNDACWQADNDHHVKDTYNYWCQLCVLALRPGRPTTITT